LPYACCILKIASVAIFDSVQSALYLAIYPSHHHLYPQPHEDHPAAALLLECSIGFFAPVGCIKVGR